MVHGHLTIDPVDLHCWCGLHVEHGTTRTAHRLRMSGRTQGGAQIHYRRCAYQIVGGWHGQKKAP
eukprot:2553519-Rhodomonas_salina.1